MAPAHASNERPAKRAKLLQDDGSSDNDDQESSDVNEFSNVNGDGLSADLKINKEYARRFEHNKKREELQRLGDKYSDREHGSESDSESQSEDDEGILATEELDAEIFSTLKAIQSKDPRVYDKSSTFYKQPVEAEDAAAKPKAKEKPISLQDYHRRNLMEDVENGGDEAEILPSYAEEQAALKRQLVQQMHDQSDDDHGAEEGSDADAFLTRKTKKEPVREPVPRITEVDVLAADKDPDTYLSNFMASRAWLPSVGSRFQPLESDDDDEDERADTFEEAFNLRFEDPSKSNAKLISHSREAAAQYSVRREEPKGRKKARETETERKRAEKAERDADKARLRLLKIEEAEEKLQKFKRAAGLKGQPVPTEQWSKFLAAGWDSDKWDTEMTKQFGDDYYAAQDASGSDEGESSSKRKRKVRRPEWDDDIAIDDIVPDFDEDAIREANGITLSDDDDEQNGTALAADLAKKSSKLSKSQQRSEQKRQARKERQKLEELVDQSMVIDSGTTPAFQPFRYRETSPASFGLTAHEILMADDAQLNQYVGLKKLAPFREAEKKERDKKRLGKKARLRKWRKETFGDAEGPRTPFQEFLASRLEGADAVGDAGGEGGQGGAASTDGAAKKKRKRSRKRKAPQAVGDA